MEPSHLGHEICSSKGINRTSLTPPDCTSTRDPGKRVFVQVLTSTRDAVCELVHLDPVDGFADSVGIY